MLYGMTSIVMGQKYVSRGRIGLSKVAVKRKVFFFLVILDKYELITIFAVLFRIHTWEMCVK